MAGRELAAYIAAAAAQPLPDHVEESTLLHIADTVAAIVAGSTLEGGRVAGRLVADQPAEGLATVIGRRLRTRPAEAAFANAMSAHADECDDHNQHSVTHPGCAIVPAALATAEHVGATGADLIRAVALGYDVCSRAALALGEQSRDPTQSWMSPLPVGASFGASAAVAALLRLSIDEVTTLLTYTAQTTSGTWSFLRDPSHVSKAFVFGGRPAREAVWCGQLVTAGFTAEPDSMLGHPGFLSTYASRADPGQLTAELGERYEVLRTNIKGFPVGGPLQAVLSGVEQLLAEEAIDPEAIVRVDVDLCARDAHIVRNRPMVNIDAAYITSVALIDGEVTFATAHDYARRNDPQVSALMSRVELHADESLTRLPRQARLTVTLADGGQRSRLVTGVRGTDGNPMSPGEVETKVHKILTLVSDDLLAQQIVSCIRNLPTQGSIAPLGELLLQV